MSDGQLEVGYVPCAITSNQTKSECGGQEEDYSLDLEPNPSVSEVRALSELLKGFKGEGIERQIWLHLPK